MQTAAGYDTTTLWSDLHNADLTEIDATHLTFEIGGRTILVDAKDLTWTGSIGDGDVELTGGLIKGFMSPIFWAELLDVVRFNIPAETFEAAVKIPTPAALDTFSPSMPTTAWAARRRRLSGGDLADVIDTGGGADIVHAGEGKDIIRIRDNAAWAIDGGGGIDTVALSGAFDLGIAPAGQTATNIEIFDLNITDTNSIWIEPEVPVQRQRGPCAAHPR